MYELIKSFKYDIEIYRNLDLISFNLFLWHLV